MTMAVAWVDVDDVKEALGIAPSDSYDDAWIIKAVAAANAQAFRLRAKAGYADVESVAPDDDVHYGTILLAKRNFHQRGGMDDAAGFETLGGPSVLSPSMAEVRRHLGLKPAAVA